MRRIQKKQNVRGDRKMRIAMIGHKQVPSRVGGIEVVVEELATRMVSSGHMVTCYNRKSKNSNQRIKNTYKGIQIKTVPTINKKGLAAVTASFFASIFAAFGNYDIVHFHAEGPCMMLWIPKLFGKRCVATIHGLDHQRCKWGIVARTVIMLGEKCAAKYADEIIVLSRNVQEYFMEQYNRPTTIIPNGVNLPIIYPAERILEQYGLEKDSYILYLGRIVPEKGISYLIEAFKQIDTEKKLVIAGGASDTEAFYEELKNASLDDKRIIFTDFVQGRMLEELYSNAYFYVLPSDLEGMPLSLLEAMSYGNCCLTSNIPECVDVIEEHAITFQKGNVSDLARCMQELCDNEEVVYKYRQTAQEFICEKYNWDVVVKQTEELYWDK